MIASGISCWVWSALFVFLGWKAGGAALALLGFTTRWEVRLGFLAIVLIVALFLMRRRRRIAQRTADVLSGPRGEACYEPSELPVPRRSKKERKVEE